MAEHTQRDPKANCTTTTKEPTTKNKETTRTNTREDQECYRSQEEVEEDQGHYHKRLTVAKEEQRECKTRQRQGQDHKSRSRPKVHKNSRGTSKRQEGKARKLQEVGPKKTTPPRHQLGRDKGQEQ